MPRPANGGRKRGTRNKRTLAAASRPDALDHIEKVMATNDGTITPDVRLRAATVLAMYQHSRPAPSHTEAFVAVDGYEEPKTVDEARALILKLGARLARGEISVIAHDGRLKAFKPLPPNVNAAHNCAFNLRCDSPCAGRMERRRWARSRNCNETAAIVVSRSR
jgi:hypothetical protein